MTTGKAILIKKYSYPILWAAIFAELVFLYRGIFKWMNEAWATYPPDRFGPYVSVIFLCIFAYRLVKTSEIIFKSYHFGLTIILGSVIVYIIGYAADVHIIQAFSLILTGFGMVVYMMGIEWGMIMLFPFIFLVLMLPTVSFLLESLLGVFFRDSIAIISGTVLDIAGGEWKIFRSVLYLNEIDLPIKYYRHSISSPLALLMQIFIAAEIIFLKNRYKLLFTALFFIPLIVAVHSIFTIVMGWSFEHDFIKLSDTFWKGREWIPAIFLDLILIIIGLTVKFGRDTLKENKNEKK